MNFQQLRTFRELTRRGFSLTEMATVSRTTQPGLTRQVRDLESEFGFPLFTRRGNRIVGLSEPGQTILAIVERLLADADQLLQVRHTYASARSGTLTIATTPTQARYGLPAAILAFRGACPEVRIALRQCNTEQIARLVQSGEADIGIAGTSLGEHADLATFHCNTWHYQAIVPDGHPLLAKGSLTLADLAAYPILTYDRGLGGRRQFERAFAAAAVAPDIVLTSLDSDIIKQYVALGFGVGLLMPMAFDAQRDAGLRALDTGALFGPSTTRLALRRGAHLRSYVYEFMLRFVPQLTRARIDRAVEVAQPEPGRRSAARTSLPLPAPAARRRPALQACL